MTRRSPSSVVDSYSAAMPLRPAPEPAPQQTEPSFTPSFTGFTYRRPQAATAPPPPASAAPSDDSSSASSSQHFLLADMDGRSVKDNRACASCIKQLYPHEVSQINWHLDADDDCRLCQVAATKPEAFTKPFCDFLTENPTVFHTVEYSKSKLRNAGYVEVRPALKHVILYCSQANHSPRSFLRASLGPARSTPVASTSSHATAPPSSPSPSAAATRPAPPPVSAWSAATSTL